jgi:hypothetical protein
MSKHRLIISEYFENLIHELDVIVETLINACLNDTRLVDDLNKQRSAFIDEIRECEASNLSALSDRKDLAPDQELTNQELFSQFCFYLPFEKEKDDYEEEKPMYKREELARQMIGLRLVVTDKYLSEEQIECFKGALFGSKYSLFFEGAENDEKV